MAEEAHLELNEVPWDRLLTFHGRASNIPLAIRDLATPDARAARAAVNQLRLELEHQDGVVQATPLTIPHVIAALNSCSASIQVEILQLLRTLMASAAFQGERPEATWPAPPLRALLAEEKLLPPFVSDDEDEMLWEETGITDDIAQWAAATVAQVIAHRPIIEELARSQNVEIAAVARQLINQIETLSVERSASASETRDVQVKKTWWRFW